MNKLKKLVVAHAASELLRRHTKTLRSRKINVTNRDGEVIGQMDALELSKNILRAAEIEFSVDETGKETHRVCPVCGRFSLMVRMRGSHGHLRCGPCTDGTIQRVCAGYGDNDCPVAAKPTRSAFIVHRVVRRKGGPWRCGHCSPRNTARIVVKTRKRNGSGWETRKRQTHCNYGHEKSPENTISNNRCRICVIRKSRDARARLKGNPNV